MALPKPWAQNKNQNQPYGGYGQNVGYGGSGIQSIYGGYGGAGGSYGASPYGDYGMSTLPGQMNAYVGLDANNVARDKNWYDYDIAWNRGNLDRLLGMTGLKNQYDLGLDNNNAQRQIANWQTGRQLEGQKYGADQNLAGLKYGADANTQQARIGNEPALLGLNNQMSRFNSLLPLLTSVFGQLGGIGNGGGGGGGGQYGIGANAQVVPTGWYGPDRDLSVGGGGGGGGAQSAQMPTPTTGPLSGLSPAMLAKATGTGPTPSVGGGANAGSSTPMGYDPQGRPYYGKVEQGNWLDDSGKVGQGTKYYYDPITAGPARFSDQGGAAPAGAVPGGAAPGGAAPGGGQPAAAPPGYGNADFWGAPRGGMPPGGPVLNDDLAARAQAAAPQIDQSPVYGAGQQQALLNQLTGANDTEAINAGNQLTASRAGAGMSATSPYTRAMQNIFKNQAGVANQKARTDVPLQFAQANSDKAMQVAGLRNQQYQQNLGYGMQRRGQQLQAMNPLLQLLGQFAA